MEAYIGPLVGINREIEQMTKVFSKYLYEIGGLSIQVLWDIYQFFMEKDEFISIIGKDVYKEAIRIRLLEGDLFDIERTIGYTNDYLFKYFDKTELKALFKKFDESVILNASPSVILSFLRNYSISIKN